jgi:hypothetical protein
MMILETGKTTTQVHGHFHTVSAESNMVKNGATSAIRMVPTGVPDGVEKVWIALKTTKEFVFDNAVNEEDILCSLRIQFSQLRDRRMPR